MEGGPELGTANDVFANSLPSAVDMRRQPADNSMSPAAPSCLSCPSPQGRKGAGSQPNSARVTPEEAAFSDDQHNVLAAAAAGRRTGGAGGGGAGGEGDDEVRGCRGTDATLDTMIWTGR